MRIADEVFVIVPLDELIPQCGQKTYDRDEPNDNWRDPSASAAIYTAQPRSFPLVLQLADFTDPKHSSSRSFSRFVHFTPDSSPFCSFKSRIAS